MGNSSVKYVSTKQDGLAILFWLGRHTPRKATRANSALDSVAAHIETKTELSTYIWPLNVPNHAEYFSSGVELSSKDRIRVEMRIGFLHQCTELLKNQCMARKSQVAAT